MNAESLKSIVQQKYAEIANKEKEPAQSSCCGSTGCCDSIDYTVFSDDYSEIEGYNADADLGLGCGLPTEYADIKPGNHVLDLGSGAGNDCFVARTIVGDTGKVTGLDFTDAMLQKARANQIKTGFENIEFVKGDIEQMPLPDDTFDVVISNCVLNLVPDKQKAFGEIYRILKPQAHFCISDVVVTGKLPKRLQEAAEMYAGCVSGALVKEDYLNLIVEQGFKNVEVVKEKEITIPNTVMLNYITLEELRELKKARTGIYSITVKAKK